MFRWARSWLICLIFLGGNAFADDYLLALNALGRAATTAELSAWDIDVRPDFTGLPVGTGSVEQGEVLWLDQCASCHGDFGDSNEVFSPIVLGNITENDIETGRVAALTDPAVVRTTFMKVATLSTVWDYINRAMPWNAPKSLAVDEVYALVAYLLNLAYIVDGDFVLSDKNIKDVQALMPNRNGMTEEHGLWSVSGVPDVVGSACTTDCAVNTTITSSLPDYAMNAHGNLRDQMRDYGPFPGVQTAPASEVPRAEPQSTTSGTLDQRTDDLLSVSGCTACHQMNKALVGPGFSAIRDRYAGRDAKTYLANKIKQGGQGVWGSMPMPAMTQLDDTVVETLALWLASGK